MKKLHISLLIAVSLSVIASCSKDDFKQSQSEQVFSPVTKTLAENPDSVLLNYVSLKKTHYSLNLSITDAERLGVTKEKYQETIAAIAGLNKHIQERIDSGDIVQCLPPPAEETKTLIRYDDEINALLGQFESSGSYYIMAPQYVCAFISGSSSYSSVTINLQGAYSANYTITNAQCTPNTSAHLRHPGPGLPLPEGQEPFSDYYNTHDWTFTLSHHSSWTMSFAPMLTLYRRSFQP